MPYLGLLNGKPVGPTDVSKGATVICPACDGEMSVRRGHLNSGRFVPRHFAHKGSADCSGESAIHARMKAIAASQLDMEYPEATVKTEIGIGDSGRIADVVVFFDSPEVPFGDALAVEVQHKHKEKNIGHVTNQYLERGYSVCWAYQSDFEGGEFELPDHRTSTVWPDRLPDRSGLEGYSEAYQEIHREGRSAELEIPFPGEYWQQHAREIASPTENSVRARRWQTIDDVWLHSTEGEMAWFTVLWSTKDGPYLEAWRKDNDAGASDFIPFRLGDADLYRFKQFLDTATSRIENGQLVDEDLLSESGWRTVAETPLTCESGVTGGLILQATPDDDLTLAAIRRDQKGNDSVLIFQFLEDDLGSLSAIQSPLQKAIG